MGDTLPAERESRFWAGDEEATSFFMGQADVHHALARLAATLDRLRVLRGERVAMPSLAKLASGLTAPHRLEDLADVLELPPEPGEDLDLSVRAKYDELWQAAQTRDRE